MARVLGLIEDNIGMRLLLATRLKGLGYQVTILSAPVAFRERLEVDSFDWIILDAAALPPVRRRFLDHLRRHRKGARVVWCGKSPHWTSVPLEATFEKPLRYDEIERFFSHWTSDPVSVSDVVDVIPWKPVGGPTSSPHRAADAQHASADTSGAEGTRETDDDTQQ